MLANTRFPLGCALFFITCWKGSLGQTTVKVMSWNIWRCGYPFGGDGPTKIGQQIADADPDVACLQETFAPRMKPSECIQKILNTAGSQYDVCSDDKRFTVACLYKNTVFNKVRDADKKEKSKRHFNCQLELSSTKEKITLLNLNGIANKLGQVSMCRYKQSSKLTDEKIKDRLAKAEKKRSRFLEKKIFKVFPDSEALNGKTVIFVGDFASPSTADFVEGTKENHCGLELVTWPVTETMAANGFVDAYREVNPDPIANPGNTFSPVFTKVADRQGTPISQERIDYQYYKVGDVAMAPVTAQVYPDPAPTDICESPKGYKGQGDEPYWSGGCGSSWPSDHYAVLVEYSVGG